MKTLIGLLGMCLLTQLAQAQNLSTTPTKTTATTTLPVTIPIIGVWTFVGEPGQAASPDKKVKIILDSHWMFSQPDPATNLTLFHHGGTYLLDGNKYAETIEYANETTGGLLHQTFRYDVSVKGDTLLLKGIGNPWNEVWKRVR